MNMHALRILAVAALLVVQAPFAGAADKAPAGDNAAAVVLMSDAVRKEMETLVFEAVQVASPSLQTADTFEPYGVLKMRDGRLQIVRWGKPNPPPATEIFRQITLAIRSESRKPEVVAAITVAPTELPTSDGKTRVHGIRAEVDHREGAPQLVLIPFGRDNGKLILGTTVYTRGTNPLFDHAAIAAAAAAEAGQKAAVPAATTPVPAKPAAAKPTAAKPAPKAATK